MSDFDDTVVFVWPGDLHLETFGQPNHAAAEWMVEEVNTLIRPDFLQWAGDNVQQATNEQFTLFQTLCSRLTVPNYPLVGDHDVHHDAAATAFRDRFGETYGAFSLRGFRFIRLNTLEFHPLGISQPQIHWFRYEVDSALSRGEQVVLFQHHYPFQIMESFDGPGIDDWRNIHRTRKITALFSGHTHYGQIANDGQNVMVATRSIGDPEGGPAGYSLVFLRNNDLAVTYRTVEDEGPVALITHPRDVLLATGSSHIVSGDDLCEVRTWSAENIVSVRGQIDTGDRFDLESCQPNCWRAPLSAARLSKGEHDLAVEITDSDGRKGRDRIRFMVDRSGRYTPFPRVRPEVLTTQFC